MGANSKIEWTDHTFNPWIGCTHAHIGCTRCYAEAFSKRTGKAVWGPNGTRVKTSEANWRQPLKWNREAEAAGERRRVFCASLADVFEDWDGQILDKGGTALRVSPLTGVGPWLDHDGPDQRTWAATLDDLRRDLFALIDQTPWLDWLLLTKRPENVQRMWLTRNGENAAAVSIWSYRPNVYLGASISNQATADRMVPELLKCRDLCPVLFLSAEPLLGPIELGHLRRGEDDAFNALDGIGGPNIDWVIVGGESGPGARPMHPDWARSLRDQCQAAGVPFFFKQWGEWQQGDAVPGGDLGGEFRAGKATILAADGSPNDGHFRRGRGDVIMRRVGKKAAGRLLGGREWSEFPNAVEAGS